MFKVGQKVVFIHNGLAHPDCILPKNHEIITISGYARKSGGENCYYIIEYPKCSKGDVQDFMQCVLRPIDYTFGENLAEEIQEEINQEQLVNA